MTTAESPPDSERVSRTRLLSVDAVRGLVMILMCLDHTRDFFGDQRRVPEDLLTTTPLLFGTRWVTHFCASTFVFLAGMSAFLYGRRRTRSELSWFLMTRGIWLIFLEFTVIHFAWLHTFAEFPSMLIVIAAIGLCMIIMAGLVWLSPTVVGIFGLVIIVGHNLLDPIVPEDLGHWSQLWILLHEGGFPFQIGSWSIAVGYPILAWLGVMAAGYGFGFLWSRSPSPGRLSLLIGGGATAAFLVVRAANGYGCPNPWESQTAPLLTVCSFLNCRKYPPSLSYLLMTLGPMLMLLGYWSIRESGRSDAGLNSDDTGQLPVRSDAVRRFLAVPGRVPLFFYILHLYLLHAAVRLWYLAARGDGASPMQAAFRGEFPDTYGFGLETVYVAWILMLAILWPLCLWYGRFRRQRREWYWSLL